MNSLYVNLKLPMVEENQTPTGQFVEIGDAHNSGESATEGGDTLQSQLLDHRLSSCEIDRRMNAIVAPLVTQTETFIQSLREIHEKSWKRSSEGNAASERSRLSVQCSTVTRDRLF